jgi:pimeloyl-ACP methyl ester carboxylesterase
VTTFALVHGTWHGAWCWDRLIPELEDRGHGVIAMDLPSDDPTATFDDYADAVAGELEAHRGDDLVVVGHSLAGLTIPLVPTRQRVSRLVYLCALVPVPGSSFMDQLATEDMLHLGYVAGLSAPDSDGRRGWADEGLARDFMYADCDPEATKQAVARLRPQAQAPYARRCSLDAFPGTPATYVVCSEDRLVKPDWSRSVARERLDADLVQLPGSHSPFLSRPPDLASVLHDVAQRGQNRWP